MEIRQIISFVSVAETGSISHAAMKCHLTQGAVSQQIRLLEDELGVQLFIRTRKEMLLTDVGRSFLIRAKNIIREMNLCKEEVSSMNGKLCGELNIGIGSFIEPLMGPAIAEFMIKHPEVKVRCQYDYAHVLNKMLRCHDLDIAFSMNQSYNNEGIISAHCMNFKLYAIMRKEHPLSSKDRLTKDDLLSSRIILPDIGMREIETMQKDVSMDMHEILSIAIGDTNNANALLNAVSCMDALTFLPKEYVLHRKNLIYRPVEGFEMPLSSNSHVMADAPVKASVKELLSIINTYKNGDV